MVESIIGIESILYYWFIQDFVIIDKILFIGLMLENEDNIFVVIGFKKWGMILLGVVVIFLLDFVERKDNLYESIFMLSCFYLNFGLQKVIFYNIDVVKYFIKGKFEKFDVQFEDIVSGDGKVVIVNGKCVGVFWDEKGCFYFVDMMCIYLGCEVEWNDGEYMWDCLCYGLCFKLIGEVVEGLVIKLLK